MRACRLLLLCLPACGVWGLSEPEKQPPLAAEVDTAGREDTEESQVDINLMLLDTPTFLASESVPYEKDEAESQLPGTKVPGVSAPSTFVESTLHAASSASVGNGDTTGTNGIPVPWTTSSASGQPHSSAAGQSQQNGNSRVEESTARAASPAYSALQMSRSLFCAPHGNACRGTAELGTTVPHEEEAKLVDAEVEPAPAADRDLAASPPAMAGNASPEAPVGAPLPTAAETGHTAAVSPSPSTPHLPEFDLSEREKRAQEAEANATKRSKKLKELKREFNKSDYLENKFEITNHEDLKSKIQVSFRQLERAKQKRKDLFARIDQETQPGASDKLLEELQSHMEEEKEEQKQAFAKAKVLADAAAEKWIADARQKLADLFAAADKEKVDLQEDELQSYLDRANREMQEGNYYGVELEISDLEKKLSNKQQLTEGPVVE